MSTSWSRRRILVAAVLLTGVTAGLAVRADLPVDSPGFEADLPPGHELRSPSHELSNTGRALTERIHSLLPRVARLTLVTDLLRSGTHTLQERAHRLGSRVVVIPEQVPAPVRIEVSFAFNSSALSDSTRRQLVEEVGALDPLVVYDVSGHADRVGRDPYNRALSARRADTVADFLVAHGIRVRDWAFGETCPRAVDRTGGGRDVPAARALNRRVVVTALTQRSPTRAQECLPTSRPVRTRIHQ